MTVEPGVRGNAPTRRLPPVLRGLRRRQFAWLAANGLGQALTMVAAAYILRVGFDGLIDPAKPLGDLATVAIPIGLGLATALLAGLAASGRRAAERFAQDYVVELRLVLFDRLMSLSSREVKARSQGPMMLRFATDLTAVRQWLSQGFARLVVAGLGALGGLAALVAIDPTIGAITSGIVGLGVATAIRTSRPYHASVDRARRRRSRMAANLGDKLAATGVARAFGQLDRERRRLRRQGDKLAEAMVRQAGYSGLLRILPDLAMGMATAIVLVVGARGVAADRITPGVVVASLAVLGILARPLRDLGRSLEYWQAFRVGRRRLLAFLGTEDARAPAATTEALSGGDGRLEFRQVALDAQGEISGVIEPRTLVAIAGPSGSGKSALLRLVARLENPYAGRIVIDGHDVAALAHRDVRRAVAMAGDDLPLVRGTIGSNLAYGRRRASRDEILAVAAQVGLSHGGADVSLEASVGDGGRNLPSGVRKKIALGRALLRSPTILLLDEPTSYLDPMGRERLLALLRARAMTIVVATNDLDVIRLADAVWLLEDGRLVERGPPSTLLVNGGATARYFGSQPFGQARSLQVVS